ncbi:MAG: diphthamide biosynthesis enzyme Dph2 [Candidatus Anstonellales archaeon]
MNENKGMRILLQFPEGLKQYAMQKAEELESQGHEVFLSSSNSYGACDIAVEEAKAIGADKIIHYGHAPFPLKTRIEIPVEFDEWRMDFDVSALGIAVEEFKKRGIKNVALGTTVQYVHKLEEVKKFFEKNGIKASYKKGSKTYYPGQVLGCDAGAVDIESDSVLFIGDGMFHALAIASLNVDKPVFLFHPKGKTLKQINDEIEKLRKRRKGSIIKAVDCKNFGILLSTKPGQFNPEVAKWMKKELEKRGRKAQIIVSNEFEPYALNDFLVFDCYVSSACPRIAEDYKEFEKPVLNIDMFNELLRILDELAEQ